MSSRILRSDIPGKKELNILPQKALKNAQLFRDLPHAQSGALDISKYFSEIWDSPPEIKHLSVCFLRISRF
jgi:hypothetical protein